MATFANRKIGRSLSASVNSLLMTIRRSLSFLQPSSVSRCNATWALSILPSIIAASRRIRRIRPRASDKGFLNYSIRQGDLDRRQRRFELELSYFPTRARASCNYCVVPRPFLVNTDCAACAAHRSREAEACQKIVDDLKQFATDRGRERLIFSRGARPAGNPAVLKERSARGEIIARTVAAKRESSVNVSAHTARARERVLIARVRGIDTESARGEVSPLACDFGPAHNRCAAKH